MNNEILLVDKKISYTIKKNRHAKQVRLMIHKNGRITVSAPRFVTKNFIKNFITHKSDWVLSILSQCQSDDPEKTTNAKINYKKNKRVAMQIVRNKIIFFSKHYNLHPKKIYIRNQSTRWGSCSSKGNLSFNFRLIHLAEPLLDYLIVHELCHLQEMNHSIRFWDLVAKTIPDYKKRKTALRAEGRRLL